MTSCSMRESETYLFHAYFNQPGLMWHESYCACRRIWHCNYLELQLCLLPLLSFLSFLPLMGRFHTAQRSSAVPGVRRGTARPSIVRTCFV